MRSILVCAILLLSINLATTAQQSEDIVQLVYDFDNIPPIGSGKILTIDAPSKNLEKSLNIPLNGLDNGVHQLFIRAKNRAGVWSMTHCIPFLVIGVEKNTLKRLEYFFDDFADLGNGIPIAYTGNNLSIPLNQLSEGIHVLNLRAQNSAGQWSMLTQQAILKVGETKPVVAVKYFFSGNGYTSPTYTYILPNTATSAELELNADVAGLQSGSSYTLTAWGINTNSEAGEAKSTLFTYNGSTSLPKLSTQGIIFYPNPATTEITIVYDGGTKLGFKLFNMGGSVVKSGSVDGGKINVSDLPKGKYLILFENETVSAVSDILIR